jgi:ribonucleoside-diphosphate reductase alpha chain
LNLFLESPTIEQLSSMYFYAWKRGLKTTYYLRSRPATRIAKTTVSETRRETETESWSPSAPLVEPKTEQLACSLENPESCEACQ